MKSPTDEAEANAHQLLPRSVYDYYAGAAGDERTVHDNQLAFRQLHFIPRCLRAVCNVDTSTVLPPLGKLSMPLLIAPMAMQCLAHPDGEIAVAQAAHRAGIPYVLSTFSTTSLEDVAKAVGPDASLLLQLYLFRDRAVSEKLMARAKRAGFKAVVLTVDAPIFGRRHRDLRNSFQLPTHVRLANFEGGQYVPDGVGKATALHAFSAAVECDLTADALKWVVEHSSGLPVWVKGILHPSDAKLALDTDAAGIIVSNHGGRQVEGAIPTMRALPSVLKGVGDAGNVLVDSGVRGGEDVLRAVACGAKAVLLGRPVLWALAEGGEEGVYKLLCEVREALRVAMAVCGVAKVSEISRELVVDGCMAKL